MKKTPEEIEAEYAKAIEDVDAMFRDEQTRAKERLRLEAQKAVELALKTDEELAPYPRGKTVSDVIAEGLIRQPVKRSA